MNESDWEKAKGVLCDWCGQETMRLIPFKDMKICPSCLKRINSNDAEIKELKNRLRMKKGV